MVDHVNLKQGFYLGHANILKYLNNVVNKIDKRYKKLYPSVKKYHFEACFNDFLQLVQCQDILQCWHIRVNYIEGVCHCVLNIKALYIGAVGAGTVKRGTVTLL